MAYSTPERATLLALMASGREVASKELKDTYFRQACKNVEAAARGDRFDVDNFDLDFSENDLELSE